MHILFTCLAQNIYFIFFSGLQTLKLQVNHSVSFILPRNLSTQTFKKPKKKKKGRGHFSFVKSNFIIPVIYLSIFYLKLNFSIATHMNLG